MVVPYEFYGMSLSKDIICYIHVLKIPDFSFNNEVPIIELNKGSGSRVAQNIGNLRTWMSNTGRHHIQSIIIFSAGTVPLSKPIIFFGGKTYGTLWTWTKYI
jgi:hypothetical protein